MTKLETYLKQVEERLNNATEGPWYNFSGLFQHKNGITGVTKNNNNSNFIAHSRTDLEVLLKMVKLMKKELEVIQYQQSSKESVEIATSVLIDIDDLHYLKESEE